MACGQSRLMTFINPDPQLDMDDLKDILRRAKTEAAILGESMVIGRDGDHWYFVPKGDFTSDSIRPGIIVDASGIRYPEHQALIEKILLGGD